MLSKNFSLLELYDNILWEISEKHDTVQNN